MPLAKSANVTLSRYKYDTLFDNSDDGWQECGLSSKTLTTETGLSDSTDYYFGVNVDGAGAAQFDFDTNEKETTFGAVIDLMNTAFTATGIFDLVGGDLRCTSDSTGPSSAIALSVGESDTDLFASLTGFTAFDEAVAGSWNTKYHLLKLYENGDSGYWCKTLRTTLGITKAINAIDQEALTFEVSTQIKNI